MTTIGPGRRMRVLVGVNAVVALVVELALLAALVATGLLLPAAPPVRIVVAVLLPLAVVVVWGVWLAPRAARPLGPRGSMLLQSALYAFAVVVLAASGAVGWALGFAVLAAARLVLAVVTGRV